MCINIPIVSLLLPDFVLISSLILPWLLPMISLLFHHYVVISFPIVSMSFPIVFPIVLLLCPCSFPFISILLPFYVNFPIAYLLFPDYWQIMFRLFPYHLLVRIIKLFPLSYCHWFLFLFVVRLFLVAIIFSLSHYYFCMISVFRDYFTVFCFAVLSDCDISLCKPKHSQTTPLVHRRKFRSQTSDNVDKCKSRGVKSQGGEEKK